MVANHQSILSPFAGDMSKHEEIPTEGCLSDATNGYSKREGSKPFHTFF